MLSINQINLCLCLLALRDLRLRCNLHPIHGAIVEVVDGVYDGMEG